MAEKCTKTSSPFSRWMKPNPFPALNHFTVPVSFIYFLFLLITCDLLPDVSLEENNRSYENRSYVNRGYYCFEDLCSGLKRRERIQDRLHNTTFLKRVDSF